MYAYLTLLTMVISGSLVFGKAPKDQITKDHVGLVRSLHRQRFFKEGTCNEVANTILAQIGLPEIGKTSVTTGRRGTFDRTKASGEIPVLNDELVTKDNSIRIEIQTLRKINGTEEEMEVRLSRNPLSPDKRISKTVHTQSTFSFQAKSSQGHQQCIFKKFTIAAVGEKASSHPGDNSLTLDFTSCLNVFLFKPNSKKDNEYLYGVKFSWLKDDCAFAMHYSDEVRKILKMSGSSRG